MGIDDAIDLVFHCFDALLRAGLYRDVDRLLASLDVEALDVEALDVDVLIAVLTVTLPAKDLLAQRDTLVRRIETRLRAKVPAHVDEILLGLR